MPTFLIVDDSPTMRKMVTASLAAIPGAAFVEAGSGLEAIERIALAPVSLMVLDLNMPDMHGLEVLAFVRGHRAYRGMPVIVLTTRGDDMSREAALAAGASRFVTKPFSPQSLAAEALALVRVAPGAGDAL